MEFLWIASSKCFQFDFVVKFSDIAEETRQNLAEIEGDKVSYGARLHLIQNIEKAIDSERKAMEEAQKKEAAKVRSSYSFCYFFNCTFLYFFRLTKPIMKDGRYQRVS